jgi:hypothetical protein
MKEIVMKMFVFVLVASLSGVANAESLMDVIANRLGNNDITIGEKLSPVQMVQKQLQAPQEKQFQAPSKLELQAPQKVQKANRVVHACTLIPGRARRVARREDRIARQSAALELRLTGRTLLETACASCDSGATIGESLTPVSLTNLSTRELLEGGSVPQTRNTRTVNEPGVCGSGGSCNGGRRGIFRRR